MGLKLKGTVIEEKRRKNAEREKIRRQKNGAISKAAQTAQIAEKVVLVNCLYYLEEKPVHEIVEITGFSRAQIYRYIVPKEELNGEYAEMTKTWFEYGEVYMKLLDRLGAHEK